MSKFFSYILLVALFSCKNISQTTKQRLNNNSQVSENVYRFSISFISIGSGTDKIAIQQFLEYIRNYETKKNIKITMEKSNWGREGEIEYCLKLSELKESEQTKFVTEVKDLLQQSRLVRFSENTSCKYKHN